MLAAVIAWFLGVGLCDAGVILRSTEHNPAPTTLAIAGGMVLASVAVTVVLFWVFDPDLT